MGDTSKCEKSSFVFKIKDVITEKILKDYLDQGWESLSNKFKSAKEYNEDVKGFAGKSKQDQKTVLKVLGALREHIVHQAFTCAQGKHLGRNEYFAAGSTNITSDYDVSVTGPEGNEIMWKMFKAFLNHYKNSLPLAFDSNLYSGPLFVHKTKGDTENKKKASVDLKTVRKATVPIDTPLTGFPRVDYQKRNFTLIPQTLEEVNEELAWAGIKLLSKDVNKNLTELMKILNKSSNLKKYLLKQCETIDSDEDYKQEIGNFKFLKQPIMGVDPNKDTKRIFKNYYLQYKSQKKVHDYVYKGKNFEEDDYEEVEGEKKTNIFFYSNKANYFASEAYYTSSAVNSVVVENQLKHSLDYGNRSQKIKTLCKVAAAMEQVGDMTNHIFHTKVSSDNDSLKKILIKFSKYIYRFWHILGTIGDDFKTEKKKAEDINDIIIPIRKHYYVDKIRENEWKLLEVDIKTIGNSEKKKKEWLTKIRKIMLDEIEKILKKSLVKGVKKKRSRRKKKRKKRKRTKRKN